MQVQLDVPCHTLGSQECKYKQGLDANLGCGYSDHVLAQARLAGLLRCMSTRAGSGQQRLDRVLASSGLVLTLQFVVVSCHSLEQVTGLLQAETWFDGRPRAKWFGWSVPFEMSLLGSFRNGRVFGPVRRLRAGGPAPVGDGVSMACSPALGLSPRHQK